MGYVNSEHLFHFYNHKDLGLTLKSSEMLQTTELGRFADRFGLCVRDQQGKKITRWKSIIQDIYVTRSVQAR
jgi:hypothetical protein